MLARLRPSARLLLWVPDVPSSHACVAPQCIARYLRARGWDPVKATRMLENTLKWRDQAGVDKLKWDDVKEEAATGKTYRLLARDKMGRPVLGLRPARENTRSHVNQIRFLIYNMETLTRSTKSKWAAPPRGSGADLSPEQLTLYLDFTVRKSAELIPRF